MALFQFKWLRRFVRKHTNPIPENSAEIWKQRLSFGYAFLAWNAFGFICYMIYTGRNDWARHYGLKSDAEAQLSPAQFYSSKLNVERGKIIRVKGLTVQEEIPFDVKSNSDTAKTESK